MDPNFIFWNVSFVAMLLYWYNYGYRRVGNMAKQDQLFFFVCVLLVGFVGARALAIVEQYIIDVHTIKELFSMATLHELLKTGGQRIYGGLLLNVTIFYLITSFTKYRIGSFVDQLAIALCIAMVLSPIGCQVSGHGCYGTPSSLPWAMDYSWGSDPAGTFVHPTPLYSLLFHLLLLPFLVILDRKKKYEGSVFIQFMILSSLYNFVKEFIRKNDDIFWYISLSHIIYFMIIIACLLLRERLIEKDAQQYTLLDTKANC